MSKSQLDLYVKGTRAWFPDKEEGWISADLVDKEVKPASPLFSYDVGS
jgi:myosin V